jgi:hypothetical protein
MPGANPQKPVIAQPGYRQTRLSANPVNIAATYVIKDVEIAIPAISQS